MCILLNVKYNFEIVCKWMTIQICSNYPKWPSKNRNLKKSQMKFVQKKMHFFVAPNTFLKSYANG